MKKRFAFLLVAIVTVLVLSVALVGCESYKQEPLTETDATALVTSNGGSIVKQGDYLYFINGYAGYQSARGSNAFGTVKTGAIMRVKASDLANTDEEADLMANAKIVVPKAIISDATNTGFSIYGGYLYYVSPSAAEDRSGSVLNTTLQFMRTDLRGQNTQVILEIADGRSTQYKYTPNGLLYVKDGDLYFKSTAANSFKKSKDGDLIAEDVTVYMPVSTKYDPKKANNGMELADVVFYTKASEDYNDSTQTLYAYMAGGEPIEVLNKESFNASYANDSTQAYKYQFSYSLLGFVAEEDGKLTMAYTKTYYVGSTSKVAGTYLYRFDDAKFAFDAAKEKKLDDTALSSVTVLGYDEGVLTAGSPVTWYTADNYPVQFKDENGSIASPTIFGVKDGWMYYVLSSKLYCYKANGDSHVHAIGSDSVYTDFIKPEVLEINGKTNVVYFSSDNKYLYTYSLDGSGDYAKLEKVLLGKIPEEE